MKIRFLIFLTGFLILTRFNIDPDLGWHLAIGEKFLSSGIIFSVDQFSWTVPGHSWQISYIFYQVIAAFLFNHLPFFLIAMIFGLVASCGVLLICGKNKGWVTVLPIVLACGLLTVNLGIRPHTFSFLFFVIMLRFLEKKFYLKNVHVLLWFLLFALWVNFHQGFLIGLLVLVTYLSVEVLILGKRTKRIPPALVLSAIFGILGTLINPFGLGLWTEILRDSSFISTWTTIAEFQPVVVSSPANLTFAISGAVFIYILFKKMRVVEPHFFLIGAFLFAASFIASLVVFFWTAVFIFIVSRHLEFKLNIKFDGIAKLPLVFAILAGVFSICLSFAGGFLKSLSLEERLFFDGYPTSAINFLKEEKLTYHLFNEYSWGGFIDWQYPSAKVFIDGRMASWKKSDGSSILADYLEITGGKCDVLARYDMRVILVKRELKNSCFDNFQKVYEDSASQVLVAR